MCMYMYMSVYHTVTVDGKRVANLPSAAVSVDLLAEVATLTNQGLDIIARLRPRTVPPGHVYCPWKSGKYVMILLHIFVDMK